MAPHLGQAPSYNSPTSPNTPDPDTSNSNISHPRTKYQDDKQHHMSKRSYSRRQLDRIARVQAELQRLKDECEALEMYVCQLEEERDFLRYILSGEEQSTVP
ncbi:hypothetical protein BDV41DRAFT_575475 [Aspergillus transmontanensis]|uniref:BZIP domain-containing protein n=1 Tax=Aspergillus transmontanensis TaxID=1034304 RepID=A0A5N6W1V8_9EURO|nr:hypothetical protein BDV41DRAFT_575475 [Aspergillus transmontanensis]